MEEDYEQDRGVGAGFAVRDAVAGDEEEVLAIVEPVVRAGQTYAIEPDLPRGGIRQWWFAPGHRVRVAEAGGRVVGTYYLMANQLGPGSHVANCGYITAAGQQGRGVARSMCLDSLDLARGLGFRAMQFNLVVTTNTRAVQLWSSLGFASVGRIPDAFKHPTAGLVDALVMHRSLD